MRIVSCLRLLVLLPDCPGAQEKAQWQRLYTYEDSAVDLREKKKSIKFNP
jgi:hypothetical protein